MSNDRNPGGRKGGNGGRNPKDTNPSAFKSADLISRVKQTMM